MRAAPPPSRKRSSSAPSWSTMRRMCAVRAASTLFQLRKICRIQEPRIHLVHDFAILLGVGGNLLPFGIAAEGGPVLGGFGAAGVHDEIDQCVLGELGVLGHPVTDALDAVALEDFDGVVAEAGFEGFKLAFVAVVSAKFVDAVLRHGAGGQPREKQKEFSGHEDSVAKIAVAL